MQRGTIRPVAIGVFWRGDEILVFRGRDTVSGATFYRPLGGGIEFGEYGHEALEREMQEEIGAEITNARYLGTIENIFGYQGAQGHEIVLVYGARFSDRRFYERDRFYAREDDGTLWETLWKPLADFQDGHTRLVPSGLLEMLMGDGGAA